MCPDVGSPGGLGGRRQAEEASAGGPQAEKPVESGTEVVRNGATLVDRDQMAKKGPLGVEPWSGPQPGRRACPLSLGLLYIPRTIFASRKRY